jgi:hypothetical protein
MAEITLRYENNLNGTTLIYISSYDNNKLFFACSLTMPINRFFFFFFFFFFYLFLDFD